MDIGDIRVIIIYFEKISTKKETNYFPTKSFFGFENMLESLNIGESIGKMNDTSMTDSAFLKSLKPESKYSLCNAN